MSTDVQISVESVITHLSNVHANQLAEVNRQLAMARAQIDVLKSEVAQLKAEVNE